MPIGIRARAAYARVVTSLLAGSVSALWMSGGIYLVRGDDELVEMRETPYEAEEVLQALIAKFPSLLSGDSNGTGYGGGC